MKILVGGFLQESNSFSAFLTTKDHFQISRGKELMNQFHPRSNAMLSGIIAAAEDAGATVIPGVRYGTQASGGPILKSVMDEFLTELLEIYDSNAPIDGIFLELHGASHVTDFVDGCGEILKTIRDHVGKDVVIAHSSDLHGNITTKMFKNCDGTAGFQTYPHVDFFDTGYRAATHGLMKLQGKPFAQACVHIPMIVPAEGYNTNEGVFSDLVNDVHELVKSGKIIDFSVYQMQPWLNLPDAASTVLVTAENKDTAAAYAQELAHRLFDLRKEMGIHLYSVDEVIDAALANETDMPVVLVDSADSPNAGSSADSSYVLSRLLERGETIKTCLAVADAPAAAHAFEVGIGNEGEFSLGGTCEPTFQKATKVRAYVKSLHDGIYPTFSSQGAVQHTGKTAVLQIGNIDIVVYSKMGNSSDPQSYRAFGIEPAHYRLVMVKSANQYKVLYRQFSTLFYPADTPGSSTANLASLPFTELPRPFYPLDNIDTFDDTVIFHD